MKRARSAAVVATLVVFGTVLAGWTVLEGRRQRRNTEVALTEAASLLAGALGPGLVAAGAAVRELDEIVSWKLLDNARLFAALGLGGDDRLREIERLAEDNGLDAVVFLDERGRAEFTSGEPVAETMLEEITEILSGRTEEAILGSSLDTAADQIAAAVARPAAGAVLVLVEASAARTFARRLGIENLLEDLVGTGGVLYLAYSETPVGLAAEATWDGGPVPAAGGGREDLTELRGRSVFEVEVDLAPLPGHQAVLRVGLDGAPLERAATAATRRTTLVGIVLAAFAVVAAAFAAVSRLRSQERHEAAARVAEADAARRRSERLAAAGALTAGLAHEVRSPMNAIGLAAQRLKRSLGKEDERFQIADRIHREIGRLEGVLREFLELAQPVGERSEAVDLGALGREVGALLSTEAEERGLKLEPPKGSALVEGDSSALQRALVNLVRNAMQASSAGGRIDIALESDRETVTVVISDEGSGIDAEIEGRLFDAFVSGRTSGTGLGLSLVRRVAEEHDGTISLTNRSGGGAQARLTLPGMMKEQ